MAFPKVSEFINAWSVQILLLVTSVVYFNSLFNGYALDDELYALHPDLADLSWEQITKIFSSATFNDKGTIGYDYRPLAMSSFFVEYLIFGKHVLVSHIINLIMYLLVIVQFFRILVKLGMKTEVTLIVMLLFALHPVHTEVVCNLKNRDELLAFIFALIAFRLAIHYYKNTKIIYLFFAFLSLFVSFLSKQTTTAFVVSIPISLALCFGFDRKKILAVVLMLLGSVIIFMLIRKQIIPINTRKFVYYESPFSITGGNFLVRISTGLDIALRYLKLLIVPHPLVYYYGYKYVDVSDFRSVTVLLSIFIHFAFVIFFIKSLKTNRLLALGVFFYLVNVFLFTFFIRKVPGLMGERFLFAASLGYCIALTFLVQKVYLFFTKKANSIFNPITAAILILFALLSFNRNKAWKDKETLYSHDMRTLENSAKANLLYGSLLSEQGLKERNKAKLETAIYRLQRATLIVPDYALAWENLGVLYYFNGDHKNALSCLTMAILKDSLNGKAFFDKAVIYESMHYYTAAEKFYLQSLKRDPFYIPGYLKFMNLLERKSRTDQALLVGKIGATQEKKSDRIYSEMIRIALTQKDTVSAIGFSEKAVVVNPKNTERIKTLENYFRSKGNIAKADFYGKILIDEKH